MLTVEIDRDCAKKIGHSADTLTEEQEFAWGQAFDHLRRQCRAALSQPDQGEAARLRERCTCEVEPIYGHEPGCPDCDPASAQEHRG